ncbi:hypothetical protein [Schnuerera sp.]|uniref:hypothetical protein n=1 Tax=Schnuerera sp. TaxID=2794844 RepID=UPI002CC3E747|nr:hypothetical protein [Schnuerera sp.]HSH36917.1 hypothetical protein [Schnuerera sp.]
MIWEDTDTPEWTAEGLTVYSTPPFVDLYGGQIFSNYPLILPVGLDSEPPFTLPTFFLLGKVF